MQLIFKRWNLTAIEAQSEGFIKKANGVYQNFLEIFNLIRRQAQGHGHGAKYLRLGALYFFQHFFTFFG